VGDLDEHRRAIRLRRTFEKNERYRLLDLPDDLYVALVATLPAREDRDQEAPLFPELTDARLRMAITPRPRGNRHPPFLPARPPPTRPVVRAVRDSRARGAKRATDRRFGRGFLLSLRPGRGQPAPRPMTEAEARREAAPAALVALVVLVGLAVVSWIRKWELVGLPWWIWLLLALPSLLLAIDLLLTLGGAGRVRSRRAALTLLGFLVAGNFAALGLLLTALVTASTATLGGGELLLTGFAIWTTNVIVFGLLFWELEAGGPVARTLVPERSTPDFQYPQDENPQLASPGWTPQVWDYLYVSLTNSIAFSPTDAMPLSLRAKAAMALESVVSAGTVLLVAARAVNVLGS
jgi:hypothetical protein